MEGVNKAIKVINKKFEVKEDRKEKERQISKLKTEVKTLNEKDGIWIVINNPVSIYLLKVNNRNTRARCEICSKLTIKCLYC